MNDRTVIRVVMFSGGVASWATARRVADRYGTDGLEAGRTGQLDLMDWGASCSCMEAAT